MKIKNKYKNKEEFYEITFEIPIKKYRKTIAEEIITKMKGACNIKIIPCKIFKEVPRLSVSKDDYSYTVYNSKQKSQIIGAK